MRTYLLLGILCRAPDDFFGPEDNEASQKGWDAELVLRQLVEVSDWGERRYNLEILIGSWMRHEIMEIVFEEGQTKSFKDETGEMSK